MPRSRRRSSAQTRPSNRAWGCVVPAIPFRVSATGSEELRVLASKLRSAGNGELRRKLTSAIRRAGQPAVDAARNAILDKSFESEGVVVRVPGQRFRPPARRSHGGGYKQRMKAQVERASTEVAKNRARKRDTGLRSTIARNVKVTSTTSGSAARVGVKIVVPKNIVPGWQSTGYDTEKESGWRHPVFGNKNVWVAEKAGPWFSNAIKSQTGTVRQQIAQAIADTTREISP